MTKRRCHDSAPFVNLSSGSPTNRLRRLDVGMDGNPPAPGRRARPPKERISRMHRSLLGALVLAALVVAFSAAGATASSAHHASSKAGGSLTVDLQSDFDFVDPALDYLASGWEMTYATCF